MPELLKMLSIQGCIVTIDAMGCQKAITKAIVASEAVNVLNLKANHSHLHSEVAAWFETTLVSGVQARSAHRATIWNAPVSTTTDALSAASTGSWRCPSTSSARPNT